MSNQFVCLDAVRLRVLPAQEVSPCQQLMYGVALARQCHYDICHAGDKVVLCQNDGEDSVVLASYDIEFGCL